MPLDEPVALTPVDGGSLGSVPIPIARTRSAPAYTEDEAPGWTVAQPAYRRQWQGDAGRIGGDWDDAEPGYRYGFQRAMERGVPLRNWKLVEAELASGFADWARQRGYDPRWVTWASMYEHVRAAWGERCGSAPIGRRREQAS
jgi:hypothetical protein